MGDLVSILLEALYRLLRMCIWWKQLGGKKDLRSLCKRLLVHLDHVFDADHGFDVAYWLNEGEAAEFQGSTGKTWNYYVNLARHRKNEAMGYWGPGLLALVVAFIVLLALLFV